MAISKAQGCDEERVEDKNFIGWVRRYDGPFFGERWEELDNHVDQFLRDISGWAAVDTTHDTSELDSDDDKLCSHLSWRDLVMRPRQNDKGEWSHVYVAQIAGDDYTLLNKCARFSQTGLLETWNPPRAKKRTTR